MIHLYSMLVVLLAQAARTWALKVTDLDCVAAAVVWEAIPGWGSRGRIAGHIGAAARASRSKRLSK